MAREDWLKGSCAKGGVMQWLARSKETEQSDAKRGGKRFPKRELNTWLSQRTAWDHDDWTRLLADLDRQGFHDWVSTQSTRDLLGEYLETHRKFH